MKCIFRTRGEAPVSGLTLTLTGEYGMGSNYTAAVNIGGTNYTSAQVLRLEAGTEVQVRVYASNNKKTYITLNGTTVQSGTGSYTFSLSADTQIAMALATMTISGNTAVVGVTAAITTS